jgi:Zn-dependent alcohol dehydrogenase
MINDLGTWLDAHPDVKQVAGTDLFAVAARPLATDAAMVQGCLVAAGVPAVLSDANMVQAYAGAVTGLGGVRIMVTQRYLEQAVEVLAAYDRGDFALDDYADVGTVQSDLEHDTSRGSSR